MPAKGGSQYLVDGRSHYERNKDRYIEKNTRRRQEIREFLWVWKSERGCVDCGIKDYRVLDFDHVQGEKSINVSAIIRRTWGQKRILEELEKCVVRCANCHRIVTFERSTRNTEV